MLFHSPATRRQLASLHFAQNKAPLLPVHFRLESGWYFACDVSLIRLMTYLIDPVPWDSRFFGFPIGKIEVPYHYIPEELNAALQEAHQNFRLLFITQTGNGPDSLTLLGNDCPCLARKLFYKKDVPEHVDSFDAHIKAYASTFCSPALERLAVQSGTFNQFRQDPRLAPHFEQLYLTWINFAVTKELADSVWTWHEEGKHVGLATVRCAKRIDSQSGETEKEGRIGMLSVDQDYRRQKIGTNLLKACDYWCSSLNIPVNSIVTQKENEPTIALCEKLGFLRDHENSVYHYWSPDWSYDIRRGWIVKG